MIPWSISFLVFSRRYSGTWQAHAQNSSNLKQRTVGRDVKKSANSHWDDVVVTALEWGLNHTDIWYKNIIRRQNNRDTQCCGRRTGSTRCLAALLTVFIDKEMVHVLNNDNNINNNGGDDDDDNSDSNNNNNNASNEWLRVSTDVLLHDILCDSLWSLNCKLSSFIHCWPWHHYCVLDQLISCDFRNDIQIQHWKSS